MVIGESSGFLCGESAALFVRVQAAFSFWGLLFAQCLDQLQPGGRCTKVVGRCECVKGSRHHITANHRVVSGVCGLDGQGQCRCRFNLYARCKALFDRLRERNVLRRAFALAFWAAARVCDVDLKGALSVFVGHDFSSLLISQ